MNHSADGGDFNITYPYDAEVESTHSDNGSHSDYSHSGSGFDGIDPGSDRDDDNLVSCFSVTIIGDSVVEEALEYIDLRVEFGGIFVDNFKLIILDDDSKFQYRW